MYALRAVLLLTAVYLALTANLNLSNIIAGLVLAVIILLLLRPTTSDVDWRHLPSTLAALLKYLIVLTIDLVVSGIQMTRLVLNPSLPLKPGIVAIPTEIESETAAALSAHAITITPGELVVEMDEEGTFYTHVLDTSDAQEDIKKAQEMREQMLQKIFP